MTKPAELSREQIEQFRRIAKSYLQGPRTDALCDLALSALEARELVAHHLNAAQQEALDQQAPGKAAEWIGRTLLDVDSYCPSCGHNRDESSVSSIDNEDGTHSCQQCGADWREQITLPPAPQSEGGES